MTSLDGLLEVCHAEACAEMRKLMRDLDPENHMLPSEIIGIVGILRGAQGRRTPPPKAPKPEPRGKRPQLVRIA